MADSFERSNSSVHSSSNESSRNRRRQRETTTSSISPDNRPGTPEEAVGELGMVHTEIRLDKTKALLDIVQEVAAHAPDIKREIDSLEAVARTVSHRGDVESEARIQQLERKNKELQEEIKLLKRAAESNELNNVSRVNSNAQKLQATERLNYQLKEQMKKLEEQTRNVEQSLVETVAKLSCAESDLQNEKKAREEDIQKFIKLKTEAEAVLMERNKLLQQVQDNTERISALTDVKEHLNQIITKQDSELRTQKEKLVKASSELDETKSRLSKMMGSQMKDGNPFIADLSDKNRPTKIADLYTELYDNEWTDAFDVLQKKGYFKDEKDIAKQLYNILMDVSTFCRKEAKLQTERIKCYLLATDVNPYTDRRIYKEIECPKSTLQQMKEFQRSNAHCGVEGVYQKYVQSNRTRTSEVATNCQQVPEFVQKCVEICWLMALQDPPLEFKIESQSFPLFNKEEYKSYTKQGMYIDFIAWPPLMLQKGGPLLAKGVAQGWGATQTGTKSPDVKRSSFNYSKEPKQAWSASVTEASRPSTLADSTYTQSSITTSISYSWSTATPAFQQTFVTPTATRATTFSQSVSSNTPLTNVVPSTQEVTSAHHGTTSERYMTALIHHHTTTNHNENVNPVYQQSSTLQGNRNTSQRYPDSHIATGKQNYQAGNSQNGNMIQLYGNEFLQHGNRNPQHGNQNDSYA